MSKIFKSEFLNEYFKEGLGKEDFTLEDLENLVDIENLKTIQYMEIINENPDEFIKIGSEDLRILCNLGFKNLGFEGIDFSDTEFDEITLNNLEISRCKLSSCNLDKLQVEESLALFDDIELKDNGLSQFSHMTQIKDFNCINCEQLDLSDLTNLKNIKCLILEGNVKNISSIKNLKQLAYIETIGVSNVLENLPDSENLETIIINDEDIQDIHFLRNYQNLKQVTLVESQIDISQLDTLCDLKEKGVLIEFDETKIKEQLEKRQYKFEQEDLDKIKEILHLPNYVELNDYELYSQPESEFENLEIEDIQTFNKIIESGLLSNNSIITKLKSINNVDFIVENLKGMSIDTIKYICKNKDIKFRFVIRTLNGIDSKILEQLSENGENLEFYVQGDLSHFKNQPDVSSYNCKNIKFTDLDKLVPYCLEEMREFISILEPIKEQTLEAKNDIEKFSMIRKIALMRSEYDESGVVRSEKFKKGREFDTRSLKGAFLDGKAVCVGNALGFSIISEYVGLKAKSIGGKSAIDDYGHEWNQIELRDENGNNNCYNYDLTNDPELLNKKEKNILESDEEFYKRYIPEEWEKIGKCPQSIPNELIYNASLKRALKGKEEIKSNQFIFYGDYSGKRIERQDIENILSSLTLSEMTYITDILKQTMKQVQTEKEGYVL